MKAKKNERKEVDLQADGPKKKPEPEHPVRNDSMGEADREEGNSTRFHVRITSYRKRLLDPDNLAGGTKWFTDCLRYAGIIVEDTPEEITIENRQKKSKEEKTQIEVYEL